MAKRTSKAAQEGRAAHADPERWNRRLIIGLIVAVILGAVGLIGFGWYQTQIKPLDKTVLRVGETEFNLAHVERRMRDLLEQNPVYGQSQQNALLLVDVVFQELEREAKLIEAAGDLDITVTNDELNAEIRQRGNLSEETTDSDFAAALNQQVSTSGLRENEYLQMLRADLLEQKVNTHFTELAPEREAQVLGRWIVLNADEQEEAEEALQRLEAGEDFAAVAGDLSTDTTSADQGGDLGWRTRGGFFDRAAEDFLFDAEPGERSEIISTHSGFFIVELVDQDDDRELDDFQQQVVVAREMNDWLNSLDVTLDISRDFADEDRIRALNDVL